MNHGHRSHFPVLVPAVLAVLVLALLSSCALGIKKWPKAQVKEDDFGWQGIIADRQESCLLFDGVLNGNDANLASITVELEPLGDNEPGYGCIDCPFNVRQMVELALGDPRIKKFGRQVTMSVCGLDPARSYRYRLVAKNVFDNLPDQATDVGLIRPRP